MAKRNTTGPRKTRAPHKTESPPPEAKDARLVEIKKAWPDLAPGIRGAILDVARAGMRASGITRQILVVRTNEPPTPLDDAVKITLAADISYRDFLALMMAGGYSVVYDDRSGSVLIRRKVQP
jgi:hypothetical protein